MTEQWMTLNVGDNDERVLSRPKPGVTKQWMTLNDDDDDDERVMGRPKPGLTEQ